MSIDADDVVKDRRRFASSSGAKLPFPHPERQCKTACSPTIRAVIDGCVTYPDAHVRIVGVYRNPVEVWAVSIYTH